MSVVEDRKVSQMDDADALGPDSLIVVVQNPSTNPKTVRAAVVRLAALFGGLLRAGDTMTGKLILAVNPTQALEAATKDYVDINDAIVVGSSLQRSSNLGDLPSPAAARLNIGFGNVDNTSDASKPISTLVAAALALLAPIANATMSGLLTLSGGQIAFPATQNPSSNANTLDDYEEGDWVPALKLGGAAVGMTYSTQLGRYTKIGRIVHAEFNITLTAKGSSTGSLTLTGLPIANAGVVGNPVAMTSGNIVTITYVAAELAGSVIGFYSDANGSAMTNSHIGNSTYLRGQITYSV